MDGMEILGRKCKVNDVRTKSAARPAPYGRDRDDDRSRDRPSDQADRRAPPPRGFRVSVTGLPDEYSWAQLKDLLRGGTSGGNCVQYANVSRPGFGYSLVLALLEELFWGNSSTYGHLLWLHDYIRGFVFCSASYSSSLGHPLWYIPRVNHQPIQPTVKEPACLALNEALLLYN